MTVTLKTKMLIENLFNRINDWDGTWIGFRRLKPAQNERMTTRTVVILSLFYVPFSAVFGFVIFSVVGAPHRICWLVAVFGGLQFIILQSLSAFFWNRRAARLRVCKKTE
jgi:hypothetical protein